MIHILTGIVFLYGLLFGSFLNVLIYRLPRKENVVFSRSKCASCGHVLSARDLFPVLSYMFLNGKCRYCKEKISFRYPFTEILNAIGYSLIFYFGSLTVGSIICMALLSITIVFVFIFYDRGRKNEN